ncbi:Armadillo/plakoglobin ARM repeat [Carpediemonas membranifera]|uniref:Armadillo/plakoglobin ARM repeat n=1 Tax=Carpediemonas membranifera TaxID=201153 RepID=A0A8J6BX92_9EUKA|nr:Armadillo/plakoglobin ARM repeat [Carpediemonas membranifera]|eukprot:KAG9393231.1 Armadillo/plakoglobin ARM repeat [Carpediemonas membranifera]
MSAAELQTLEPLFKQLKQADSYEAALHSLTNLSLADNIKAEISHHQDYVETLVRILKSEINDSETPQYLKSVLRVITNISVNEQNRAHIRRVDGITLILRSLESADHETKCFALAAVINLTSDRVSATAFRSAGGLKAIVNVFQTADNNQALVRYALRCVCNLASIDPDRAFLTDIGPLVLAVIKVTDDLDSLIYGLGGLLHLLQNVPSESASLVGLDTAMLRLLEHEDTRVVRYAIAVANILVQQSWATESFRNNLVQAYHALAEAEDAKVRAAVWQGVVNLATATHPAKAKDQDLVRAEERARKAELELEMVRAQPQARPASNERVAVLEAELAARDANTDDRDNTYTEQIRVFASAVQKYKAQRIQAVTDMELAVRQRDAAETANQTLEKEKQRLEARVTALSQDTRQLTEKVDLLTSQNSDASAKIKTLEKELTAQAQGDRSMMLLEEIKTLTSQLEMVRTTLHQTETERNTLTARVGGLEDEVNAGEAKLSRSTQAHEATKQTVAELSADLASLQNQLRSANTRVGDLDREVTIRDRDQPALEATLRERIATLEASEKMLQGELEAALSEGDARRVTIMEQKAELGTLQGQLKTREARITALLQDLDALNTDHAKVRQEARDAGERVVHLEEEVNAVSKGVDAGVVAEERADALQQKLIDAAKREAELHKRVTDLEAQVAAKEQAIGSLEGQATAAQGKLSDLRAELRAVQSQLREAGALEAEASGKIRELQAEITVRDRQETKMREQLDMFVKYADVFLGEGAVPPELGI